MWSDCKSYSLLMGVKIYKTVLKNYWQNILNQKLCILQDTQIPPLGASPRTTTKLPASKTGTKIAAFPIIAKVQKPFMSIDNKIDKNI